MQDTTIKDYGLRPVWNEMLAIFDEFVKLCKKHNLRYYAYAGTALGAVRHDGFIPWDDDMDLAMPRPDYERFVRIANDELPHNLRFVNWKNTPEFHLLFGKIQLSDKMKVLKVEQEVGHILSNGIFIDIFPLDGYPSKCQCTIIKVRDFFLSLLERFRFCTYSSLSWKGKAAWCIGGLLTLICPNLHSYNQFLRKHENTLLKFHFGSTENVGDVGYWHNVLHHPSYGKAVWGDPSPHKFEDRIIMLPTDVDAHLRAHFGDYMRLPSEESRSPSHQLSCHFPWWLGPTTGDKLDE